MAAVNVDLVLFSNCSNNELLQNFYQIHIQWICSPLLRVFVPSPHALWGATTLGTGMLVPALNCLDISCACVKLKWHTNSALPFYFLEANSSFSSLICSVLFGVCALLSNLVFVTPRQLTYRNRHSGFSSLLRHYLATRSLWLYREQNLNKNNLVEFYFIVFIVRERKLSSEGSTRRGYIIGPLNWFSCCRLLWLLFADVLL